MKANPFLSGERLNARVEHLREYKRRQTLAYFKAFMQDGYVVGTEPLGGAEEYASLTQQMPALWQYATDPNQPVLLRERAQRDVMRWLDLRRRYVPDDGSTPPAQEAGTEVGPYG